MDKRHGKFKEYGRMSKKPKLEIVSSVGHSNHVPVGQGYSGNAGKQRNPPASNLEDFWDDDDDADEVILLASQVVEQEVSVYQASAQASEYTFSEFAPNLKVTSTQKPTLPDVEALSQILDDDWGLDNLPIKKVFKEPLAAPARNAVSKSIPTYEPSFSQSNNPKLTTTPAPTIYSQSQTVGKINNREKAQDCQIQFLQKRIDALKKENSTIGKELEDFKSKIEGKEGEVSLLRDEIRHLKQQIQNAKQEAFSNTDRERIVWQEKISDLTKQVEAQQAQLEFKSIEVSKIKMNCLNSSRLDRSYLEQPEFKPPRENNPNTFVMRRRANRLRGSVVVSNISKISKVPMDLFDRSTNGVKDKFRKDVFHREVECLQFHMSRLHYVGQLSPEERLSLGRSIFESVKNVVIEFWTYVHTLEYNKYCQNLPNHYPDAVFNRHFENPCWSLFQAQEIYPNEKALNLRRYIAGISVFCRIVPEASEQFFTIKHNKYLLIQIIVDAITKLGFSQEVSQHFGVIEAFSLLLTVLFDIHRDNEIHHEHLMSFLKTLIFYRPNAWTMKYITQCLVEASDTFLEQLCNNAPSQTFTMSQSIYKFTPDSCVLQVYAPLLEVLYAVHHELNSSQFKLLSEICYLYLRFTVRLFNKPPRFISALLPNDDSDEDCGMSQRLKSSTKCQCYTMMCGSVVKLLYLVLTRWQGVERWELGVKLIENISKLGVSIIHTIFVRYYMTKLFDHKGSLIRHYLYFVCKYWLENADMLKFTETHREAMDQLASSHIIEINKRPMELDKSKIERDLDKWFSHSGDIKGRTSQQRNRPQNLQILKSVCNSNSFFKRN